MVLSGNGKELVAVAASKISEYLREIRLANGLTQANTAERLGITPQAVSKWERSESLPDITLLPEIAAMYGVTVEDILHAGEVENLSDISLALNRFVDERVFAKILHEFERAHSVSELTAPPDIFMALNSGQKDVLLELLLEMEGFGTVIDDILQYLNMSQRARLILRVAENGDYEILEALIPFMARAVRSEVAALLLTRGRYDVLEEMILFLNREQKDMIIRWLLENEPDFSVLENFLPFFDKAQYEMILNSGSLFR